MMIAYVTTYAPSGGVLRIEGEPVCLFTDGRISFQPQGDGSPIAPDEWFADEAQARDRFVKKAWDECHRLNREIRKILDVINVVVNGGPLPVGDNS